MQIAKHKVVTIDYVLKDDEQNLLDSSEGAGGLSYLHGALNIIPGLETALEGKTLNDEFSVRIEATDAYGERDDEKVQTVPHDMFGEQEVQVGAQYHAQGPSGEQLVIVVTSVNDDGVTIDGNHPLAGIALNFDVKVTELRDATEEEIEHGHVHGEGGHQH